IGTQGVVELKGTKPAELTAVALANNTTLGKTDEGKFSLNNITLKQGGNVTGGRLFGNTVMVNNAASGKADNLYGNTLTVAGAKTKTLDVNNGASKISGSGDSKGTEDMVWSNEYQSDTACGNTASCAKQYLLKQKGGVSSVKQYCYDLQSVSFDICDYVGHPQDGWNYAKISSSGNWRDMDKNGAYWLTYGTDVECLDAPCAPSEEAASGGLYSDPHECCLQPCAEGQKWTCDKNENCVCAEPAKPVEWEAKQVRQVVAVYGYGLFDWEGERSSPINGAEVRPYDCKGWTKSQVAGWNIFLKRETPQGTSYVLNDMVGVNSPSAYCAEKCNGSDACEEKFTLEFNLKTGYTDVYRYGLLGHQDLHGYDVIACEFNNCGGKDNVPSRVQEFGTGTWYCIGPTSFVVPIYQCVRKEN
ncbi:MAG: hypothetical protein ACI37O_04765, partial [Candidatus Avelusimicrobium sp.]|uniref:hypothetical protein n=1 Tax=Candidatus Avelusimicrobium sp. TaxID=3048833 RepID=UPI003F05DD5C